MPNKRDKEILRFLTVNEIALPPTPIHENLALQGATFTLRTVRRRLNKLEEAGYVEKTLDEKGYYQITDKGREWLRENTESDDPPDLTKDSDDSTGILG